MPKKVGGFSPTSLEDAMRAQMSKWITQALLHDQLNLQVLLRYRIKQLQPSCHGSWGPSSLWLFSPNLELKANQKCGATFCSHGK